MLSNVHTIELICISNMDIDNDIVMRIVIIHVFIIDVDIE